LSKSLKNVVNPDEVIDEYGADTFRLYEMFMGPLEASKPGTRATCPAFTGFSTAFGGWSRATKTIPPW